MSGRLVYRDAVRSVYEVDGQPGVIDHIDYGTAQIDGSFVPLPMADRAITLFDGLKQIRDSTGARVTIGLMRPDRLYSEPSSARRNLFTTTVVVAIHFI